jgi:2-phospho-L-lactate guanylyltransferase
VIIPVKPPAIGKSRLGLGADVARAVALDTIAAVVGCDAVDRVIVVTSDRAFRPPGAEVLLESAPSGIDAAVAAGAALAGIDVPRAALLGDLPALVPEELAAALSLASRSIRSFVADHEGTGTTLVAAMPGVGLVTAFGPDSAARHRALGLDELDLPAESSVRLDVDTPEQLELALRRRGATPPPAAPAPAPRRRSRR